MAYSLLNIKMKARMASMLSNENALENSQSTSNAQMESIAQNSPTLPDSFPFPVFLSPFPFLLLPSAANVL